MTFKEKYNSIDQTKLPETAKAYMVDFKKDSNNFTNKEAMAKMLPALDKFIAALKDSGYGEAIKGATKKETKKKAETPTEMAKEIVEEAIEQPKTKTGKPKVGKISKGDFMKIAKEIRKEGESWNDAMKRAGEIIRKQKEGVKTKAVRQYEKLKKFIAKHPEVYKEDIPVRGGGFRKTTLEVDAPRIALPRGKRVSKKGWKNQYGKSDGGKTYYEYRSNRFDTNRKRYPFLAKGGDIDERMYNFLIDDLASLQVAIQENDTEKIEQFFSYWNIHLKSLKPEMSSARMYYFLEDDLGKLESAINDNDKAEIEKFFSYWDAHLSKLKYAKGGETGKVIYLDSVGTYFRPSDLMTSPSSAFDDMTFRIDEIENDEWFDSLSKKDYDIISKYYDISDREFGRRYAKGGNIGKVYYEQPNVGKAKYTVNFHDGVKTHKDGSPFYDMRIFKNKTDLNNFIAKLKKEGYEYERYAKGGETDALYTHLLREYETEGYPKMGISFKTFIESKKETAMGKGDYEMYRKLFDVLDAYEGDFYAKGGEVYTSTGMVKLKKGDKVRTRDGNIETVSRINSNGNVETIENDYSHEPYTLTKISEHGGELFGAGRFAKGGGISSKSIYIPNRDINSVHAKYKDKKIALDGSDIYDGLYVKKTAVKSNSKTGGGKSTNYKKYGDDNSKLIAFDIDDLDPFESMQYENFSKNMSKAESLQILINNVEGDYSQLSPKLAKIAEEQYPSSEFDKDYSEYAKGGSISKNTTYVPNRDVKELMVVLKGELTKLKGKDILDGVYVKNKRKPSPLTESPKEIMAVLKKAAKDSDYGAEIGFDESDIKSLLESGFSAQDVKNIYIGYTPRLVNADTEFGKTTSGLITRSGDSQKNFIAEIVKNAKNGYFEIGLKYPNDFNWKPIIEKYDISREPKIIETKDVVRKNKFEIYLGKGVAIGHQYSYKYNEDKKWSKEDEYGILDSKNPSFEKGYWGIVTKNIEDMYFIVDTLLKQSKGYLKDCELFLNRLGGIGVEDVENEKFAKGGEVGVIKINDFFIVPEFSREKAKLHPYYVTNREGVTKYRAKSKSDAQSWIEEQYDESKFAKGGAVNDEELKAALKTVEGGSIFSQEFFDKYDFVKENYSTRKYDNAEQMAKSKKAELEEQGYMVKMKKVGFSDLARSESYFVTAIKRKSHFAKGGKVGFKALSDKVAKYYSNKSVPSKYQSLYGKKYDKSEAKEVGDKVAAKVYRQQLAKKK
jgi:hypothetical protein